MPGKPDAAGSASRAAQIAKDRKPEVATGATGAATMSSPETTRSVTEPAANGVSQAAGVAVSPEAMLVVGLAVLFVLLVLIDSE